MKKKQLTTIINARMAISAHAKKKMLAGALALMLTFSGVAAGPVASYAMDKTQSTDVVVVEAAPEQEMHALETEEAKSPAPAVDGAGQQQVSTNGSGITAKSETNKSKEQYVDEMNKMIDSTQSLLEQSDLYTEESLKALRAAFDNVKRIVDHPENVSLSEYEECLNALNKAAAGLTLKEALDPSHLKNGVYMVTGEMLKVDRKEHSMSDNAINHNVKLTVKDGTYTLTMNFDGLTIGDRLGYLSTLKYFKTGYTMDQYGRPQGELADAKVESYQMNEDGTYVVDQYNKDGDPYPDIVSFEMIPEAKEDGFVPLRVFVPIMESISAGNGTQEVFLHLDWSTLKQTEADNPVFSENGTNAGNGPQSGPISSGTTGSLGGGNTLGGGGGSLGGGKPGGSLGSGNNLQSAAGVQTGDEAQNNILWAAVLLLGGVSLMAGIMEYKKKKEAKQE